MKYLLTFKPLKNFFFGNNRTFSDDYLANSEYFPQNTQLLGALRLYIAEQNKLMHVHKNGKYSNNPEALIKLIGTANSRDFDTNADLGLIQNLSQMFIVKSNLEDAYFPVPFDVDSSKENVTLYELANIDNTYFLKNYDVKAYNPAKLGNANFWHAYSTQKNISAEDLEQYEYTKDEKNNKEKGFFIPYHQVGIELENKKVIDEKFYSKTDYQLRNGFLFACVLELDEKVIDNGIIQIGAENSLFELKIMPLESTKIENHPIVNSLFQSPKPDQKLIAISDVMILQAKDFKFQFSITPYYKYFAMLKSEKNSFKDISSKKKNYREYKGKTKQKRLMPAGSVIYLEESLPQLPQGAYLKMGYNQFISTKN